MAAGELQVPKGPARRPFMILIPVLSIILLAATMAGVLISPVLLNAFYAGGRDYSVSADVGQAFGGASALAPGSAILQIRRHASAAGSEGYRARLVAFNEHVHERFRERRSRPASQARNSQVPRVHFMWRTRNARTSAGNSS